MSVVVNITHEVGDLSEWTGSSTDGGDLSVTSGAALVGSYGMAFLIDDTNWMYVYKSFAQSAIARWRIYFDINSLTMASGDEWQLINIYQSGGLVSVQVKIIRHSDGYYQILCRGKNDAGTNVLNDLETLTDTVHYFEMLMTRATNSTSSDGSYEWWIDGVSKGTATGVDNYNALYDAANRFMVNCNELDAGTSGTFYVDDIIINDDGSEIGPAVTDAISKRNTTAWSAISKLGSTSKSAIAKISGVSVTK